MKELIFSIGVPGSGKTTYLKNLLEENDYEYICPDDIRVELTGDMTDQSRNKEVWDMAYSRMTDFLDAGKSVIFDATFSDIRNRKDLIHLAREHKVDEINAIWFNISPNVAIKRNQSRDRVISDDFILSMHNRIQSNPPRKEEGIDEIFIINNK